MTPNTSREKSGTHTKDGTAVVCKTADGSMTNPTEKVLERCLERAVKWHSDLEVALEEAGVTPRLVAEALKELITNYRSKSEVRKGLTLLMDFMNWTPPIKASQTNVVVQQPPPAPVYEANDEEARKAQARAREAEEARGE